MDRIVKHLFVGIYFYASLAQATLPFKRSCQLRLTPVEVQEDVLNSLFREKRIQEAIWVMKKFGLEEKAELIKSNLLKHLLYAELKSMTPIEGNNATEVYLVKLDGGLEAIFKPEPKYWKMTSKMKAYLSNMDAEISAYDVAEIIGLQVPVTIERTLEGMRGSLQVFVNHGKKLTWQESRSKTYSDTFETWALIGIFDYLIGNTDRNQSLGRKNYLEWHASGLFSLAIYDHSMAYVRPGSQRGRFETSIWEVSMNGKDAAQLMYNIKFKLTPEVYTALLKRRSHENEVIAAALKNRESLIREYEEKHGEIKSGTSSVKEVPS